MVPTNTGISDPRSLSLRRQIASTLNKVKRLDLTEKVLRWCDSSPGPDHSSTAKARWTVNYVSQERLRDNTASIRTKIESTQIDAPIDTALALQLRTYKCFSMKK